MKNRTLGVVMNGVTGRMGHRQHLVRSILAIREQGGVELADGSRVQLQPLLVGRNADKLAELAQRYDLPDHTTDLAGALADDDYPIYFDAQLTNVRESALRQAMEGGRHIYTEKPTADSFEAALDLARVAQRTGVKNGVVHDKLFLPGFRKLRRLIDGGFFGEILSVRGEFGYWVFEGDWQPAQRPSWNYRAEDGGGIVTDMFCHWNYLLEDLFGPIDSVNAKAVTHIDRRWDEKGEEYKATADDAAYAIFEIGSTIVQFNSSWCVRVNRDELVELQVDGTHGSAVAGLHRCKVQPRSMTPKPVWNPDLVEAISFRDGWTEIPDNEPFDNGFKVQWEQFIRHVVDDEPNPFDLLSGARGVRLAEAGLESSSSGRRIELPSIDL